MSTCEFQTRENNILDLFISSDPNMVDNLRCVGKLGSSDHVLVLAELNFKTCVAENLQKNTRLEKKLIWIELRIV